ncbi:hypothetical protein D8811_09540 [Streptococcus gordonii]|jgi:hypothetical protein|uniref:Uncharacterized protein n=1 Tax=Streptococcus gordonii TaxID=1302 RepID=A0AB34S8W2_STRGN|nr:hypothetical protein [Streptococcus gordonii]KJQ63697.1 hypothetical protein TZ88_01341 [Streptococcus gordonii]RSJ42859.1 hypothetical protein D8817_09865 [Streptococcus gordonii]RSJ55129.1 hypothetical protein D8811_09540 [Streptococcus gordonii]RSK11461.1 hypothetical protein D8806_05625 [Streptococcus gordonii]
MRKIALPSIRIYTFRNLGLFVLCLLFAVALGLALVLDFFLDSEQVSLGRITEFSVSILFLSLLTWWFSTTIGRLTVEGENLVVSKLFKKYRLNLSSVTLYFGKYRIVCRGEQSYPIFVACELEQEDEQVGKLLLGMVANPRQYKKFQIFYEEYLKGRIQDLPDPDNWSIGYFNRLNL